MQRMTLKVLGVCFLLVCMGGTFGLLALNQRNLELEFELHQLKQQKAMGELKASLKCTQEALKWLDTYGELLDLYLHQDPAAPAIDCHSYCDRPSQGDAL